MCPQQPRLKSGGLYGADPEGIRTPLFHVMAKRDPMLNEHLKTADRNAQYTSKTVQNEVIDLIAQYIRNEKTKALKQGDSFFAIIADEVTDPHANQEVLSVCLRLVEGTDIKEFFLDFSYFERTTGESIANAIKKSLATNGVDIT